jgi:multidrug efflux system membrane fusion protein
MSDTPYPHEDIVLEARPASGRPEGRPRSCGCLLVMLILFAGVLGALAFTGTLKKVVGGAHPSPSKSRSHEVVVKTAQATLQTMPIEVHVVGNVLPYSTVPITSQVTGQLVKVFFKQGDFVKVGQPLFQIDPRTLQATVSQVQANISRDQAQIAQARALVAKDAALVAQARQNLARDLAQQKYARSEEHRYNTLLNQGYVTREQAEQETATAQSASGTVNADRAAVSAAVATQASDEATLRTAVANMAADEAALQGANVQLGYTFIKSPINGRTGAFNLYQGALVTANSTTPLVTIDQISPIYVSFAVPEQYLGPIHVAQQQGPLKLTAQPGDQSEKPESGTVTFVDNAVDTTTGTITLRGTFPNPQHRLWPGRFVTVDLILGAQRNAVVIPNPAVNPGQHGDYVFVVRSDLTVESRSVKVERTLGNNAVIGSGIKPGETVVTDGQLQLKPGDKVTLGRENPAERSTNLEGGSAPPSSGGRHHGRHGAGGANTGNTPAPNGNDQVGGPSFGGTHVSSSPATVNGQPAGSGATFPGSGVGGGTTGTSGANNPAGATTGGPGALGAPPPPGVGGGQAPTDTTAASTQRGASGVPGVNAPQQYNGGTPTSVPPRAGAPNAGPAAPVSGAPAPPPPTAAPTR